MTILICIVILLAAILVKILINGYKLIRLINLEKKYHAYMRVKSHESEIIPDFLEKIPEIIDLFKKAGQKTKIISHIENSGLGCIQNVQVDLYENMPTRESEIYTEIFKKFRYSIGVYKKRIFESVNPIYWIEFLIFLPKKIVEYLLGEGQESIPNWLIRLLNLVYWVIGLLGSLFGILEYFK